MCFCISLINSEFFNGTCSRRTTVAESGVPSPLNFVGVSYFDSVIFIMTFGFMWPVRNSFTCI